MSATMASQGGWVQLEQSDMRLALNMTKMVKGGFSRTAVEQMQHLIKKPRAEVQQEKKLGVEFLVYTNVEAAMVRHPAMLRGNHMDGCLPYQNGTALNPQTWSRYKGTGAYPPDWLRKLTHEPMPRLAGTAPVPPSDNEEAHTSCSDELVQTIDWLSLSSRWHIAYIVAASSSPQPPDDVLYKDLI